MSISEGAYNEIADRGPIKPKDFNSLVRQWITLWCINAEDEAEEVYLEIHARATDTQWERFFSTMHDVDVWIGATSKATLRQRELYSAQQEGRKSEWPGELCLHSEFPHSVAKLIELSQRHGIPIADCWNDLVNRYKRGELLGQENYWIAKENDQS